MAFMSLLTVRYPILRGMVTYAILWPSASVIQQLLEGSKITNLDWKRSLRYSIYGSLFVAPTIFGWISLANSMWPATNIKMALIKVAVEQFSYAPFATTSFYIVMNLLEFKSITEGVEELRQKFWPTFRVSLCLWPLVQTINFAFVPERNRVVLVSVISFLWITFLAYMKQIKIHTMQMEAIQQSSLDMITSFDNTIW